MMRSRRLRCWGAWFDGDFLCLVTPLFSIEIVDGGMDVNRAEFWWGFCIRWKWNHPEEGELIFSRKYRREFRRVSRMAVFNRRATII
jgi:hypothetical protein